jgi:predicted alpha-1,2-mannosidase
MFKSCALAVILCFGLFSCQQPSSDPEPLPDQNYAQYVNPFIGTGGHGHTFPGATVPFGMVQLSPDTRLEGWDGCSGYHHTDSVVYGFSHTHLSGTGVSDYGDILLMPTTGPLQFNNGADGKPGYSSVFSKEKETATTGYYSTQLEDYDIQVELTATQRVGFHRYSLPTDQAFNVILDLDHRDKWLSADLQMISETEVAGYRVSDAWAREQHVYFVARFSQPIQEIAIDTSDNQRNYALQFGATEEPLLVKVAISPVDIEGARKNLEAEVPDWDFEAVKKQAAAKWNEQLGKINVQTMDEETKTIFYTALYHTTIVPNLFMDVDKRYRGMDMKIYEAENFDRYTVFSLWDTYRATHPLYTIIEQERTNDFINTFLRQYEEGGQLPMWELACNYTGCMIGYHAVPVIADAYIKGIRGYDAELALEAMVSTAEANELGKEYYRELGYIPAEKEHESVSKTLEYAYDDWTIAQMAKAMGNEEVYQTFIQRAQNYKNLFDPISKMMRGKTNHRWWQPFYPEEVNFNYTEANSWQYSFYVPQDVEGLAELHGGLEKLEQKLDELFSVSSETYGRDLKDISGLIGQYAHGNEPSHHMAYLYNYLDKPWKSQQLVRQILTEQYRNAPDGLSGNEDCGQMSAWYVLSSMGLYSVAPGSDQYAIVAPLLEQADIHLENGQVFQIIAHNQSSENVFIQSVKLNGKNYTRSYLRHEDILNGGLLEFELGPEPNTSWGVGENNRPRSQIEDQPIFPVPGISQGKRAFSVQDTVALNHPFSDVTIGYTLDGSKPAFDESGATQGNTKIFTEAFIIDTTTSLKAVAWHPERGHSPVIKAAFNEIPGNRSIQFKYPYATYYAAGGNMALIDGIQGADDFRTGEWQGYHGVDLNATIDLGEIISLEEIGVHFLQDQRSWIFMPTEVVFEVSRNGRFFKPIKTFRPSTFPQTEEVMLETFNINTDVEARYVRVIGKNRGVCPDWHLGAGGKAWVFADEIIIK